MIIMIDHKNIVNKFDNYDNNTLFNREVHRELASPADILRGV